MDVLADAWKIFWKMTRWILKRLVWPVLAVAASLIPAVIVGDSKGRVAENESTVVQTSQWVSALSHISILPALYWLIASAVWPSALWLLILWVPSAAFWFSRRFSAQKAVEMGVRDLFAGISSLISPAEAEMIPGNEDEQDARRSKFAPWRILTGIALVIMGAAIPFALAPAWVHLLPAGQDAVSAVSPYYPAVALGGFWILLIVFARVGVLHGRGNANADRDQHLTALYAFCLGIPEGSFYGHGGEWELSADMKTVTINPVPAPARSKLDLEKLNDRVEQFLGDWGVLSASPDEVVFAMLDLLPPEVAASRLARDQSNGLLTGYRDERDSALRPRHITWLVAPGFKAEQVDAHAQEQRLRVVSWNPVTREAGVAAISRDVQQIRDRLAGLVNAAPWEVELTVRRSAEGYVEEIHVARSPEILDPVRRRKTWLMAAKTTVEDATGTVWRFEEDPAANTMTLRRIVDPLLGHVSVAEFNDQFPNPVTDPDASWRSFPFAITEAGEPVEYTTFHTLGVGQTGAGKGSIWWSIFNGLAPAARAGLVQFFAIDPKGAEAIGDDGQPLGMFEQVATTADEWAEMIEKLVEDMGKRKGQGRRPAVTREQPLRLILIDELSALSKLDVDNQRAKAVMAGLLTIASQGRSLNTLLVGLVQAPQKDMVGDLRDFMPMRVALRTGTKTETDIVLGEGATDAGAEAHLIPLAAPGNGYASAGTGFMRVEGNPEPVRIRMPYTDDQQIEAWSVEFRELRAARKAAAAGPQVTTVGEFEFSLDDLDDETPTEAELSVEFDFELDFTDSSEAPQTDLQPAPTAWAMPAAAPQPHGIDPEYQFNP